MAESKRNEKAAQQQQARAKAVEVTMRDGKFSGLTKRNEDYLFHLGSGTKRTSFNWNVSRVKGKAKARSRGN